MGYAAAILLFSLMETVILFSLFHALKSGYILGTSFVPYFPWVSGGTNKFQRKFQPVMYWVNVLILAIGAVLLIPAFALTTLSLLGG